MARTFFELPNDILRKIFSMKKQLTLDENPDLDMMCTYGLCYCCGIDDTRHTVNYNNIRYTFCNNCHKDWMPCVDEDEMSLSMSYINAWCKQVESRSIRMYHKAVAPNIPYNEWEDFWNICLDEDDKIKNSKYIENIYRKYK